MDNKEKAFLKFNNREKCSKEEFKLALEFYNSADNLDKRLFLNVMATIIKKCVIHLIDNRTDDFSIAKEVYTVYGLTDKDFVYFFNILYGIEKFKELLARYTNISHSIYSNEYIFKRAKSLLWDIKSLRLLAKELNITTDDLNKCVKDYAFNTLSFNKSKFIHYKKIYKAYVAFLNNNNYNLEQALEYYNKYATEIEKVKFNKYVNSIINNINILLNSSCNLNIYLNSINLNIYNLFLLLKNDNKLIIKFQNIWKDLYDYAENNNWQKDLLIAKAQEYNLSYEEYIYLVKIYASNILKIRGINETIRTKQAKIIDSFNLSDVLIQILNETDKDIICKLFEENRIRKTNIINFCYSKARNFNDETRKLYEKNLMIKYKYYQSTKKRNDAFDISIDYVFGYLNSKLSIKEFCDKNGICISLLKRKINKIDDPELLAKIKDKINNEITQNDSISIEQKIRLILYYIKNGIVINNNYKNFDLLDSYVLFNDINYKRVIYPFTTTEEKRLLINFLLPLKYDSYFNRDTLINSYYEIKTPQNIKRIITKEELTYIVDFMDSYQIPMTNALFNIALKRYLEGTLDIYNPVPPTLQ